MICFVIVAVIFIVFAVAMVFISDLHGFIWLVISCLSIILLGISVIAYSYNKKFDLKITDNNGKTYVYKKVHGLNDDKSGTVSFVTKDGEQFSYRVSSMKQTVSK